jgi:hypothetical protein
MQKHFFPFGMVGHFSRMVEEFPAIDLKYNGISNSVFGILADF